MSKERLYTPSILLVMIRTLEYTGIANQTVPSIDVDIASMPAGTASSLEFSFFMRLRPPALYETRDARSPSGPPDLRLAHRHP